MTLQAGLIVAAVLALLGIGFWGGTLHGDARLATVIAQQQAQIINANTQALNREKDYATQTRAAEAAHTAELAALPTRVIRSPVWLYTAGEICPDRVSVPTAAPPSDPRGGGAISGTGGRDIRGALEAFKAHWETVMADCRENLADWPHP